MSGPLPPASRRRDTNLARGPDSLPRCIRVRAQDRVTARNQANASAQRAIRASPGRARL